MCCLPWPLFAEMHAFFLTINTGWKGGKLKISLCFGFAAPARIHRTVRFVLNSVETERIKERESEGEQISDWLLRVFRPEVCHVRVAPADVNERAPHLPLYHVAACVVV